MNGIMAHMNGIEAMTRCAGRIVMVGVGLGVAAGCRGPRVLVPPRLDLTGLERVGIVTFAVENAEGSLAEFATQRFVGQIFQAQRGVQVLELGDQAALGQELGIDRLDADAMQQIGAEYGVPAVFTGTIIVSDVKPRAQLVGIPRVEAEVSMSLAVRLRSTESGATIWSRSSRATDQVAGLSIVDGRPVFAAQDPEDAYGDLMDYLIGQVTHDLWPTYERR